ncbi:MAG: hypothetical protein JSS72_06765 [Armatimonadetes bacterium]|nr:hypothetical protein [Armatimonadota bacterium]
MDWEEPRFFVKIPADTAALLPTGVALDLLVIEVTQAINACNENYAAVLMDLVREGYPVPAAWWLVREAAVRAAVAHV